MRGSVARAGVYGLQQAPRRDRWPAGRRSRPPGRAGRGRPSRSPGRRAARARRARRRRVAAARAPSARSSRSSSRRAAQARSATGGESQVRRSLPSPQVEARSGRSTGSCSAERLGHGRPARTPAAVGALEHRAQPERPLRPPVAEQLGVDREDEQAAAAALAPRRRAGAPRSRRGTRRPGAAPQPRPRPGRRRRRRSVQSRIPRSDLPSNCGVGGVGGIAVERPEPADRLPVDRQRHRPGLGRAPARSAASGSSWALWSTQNHSTPCSASPHSRPGRVGALRQPEAAVPAEAAAVRADAGVELQRAARRRVASSGSTRVGGRGGGQRHPALRGRALERRAAGRRRPRRAAPGRAGSGRARAAQAGRQLRGDVAAGRLRRRRSGTSTQEVAQPLRRPGVLELVGEHRGHGHRQVAARPRAPAGRSGSPRRTATPRRTGRSRSPRRRACGVQDDRQVARGRPAAPLASGAADGEEVERRVEVARSARREVGGGDRRREAVVEGLGQAAAACGRRPSRASAPARGRAACGRGRGRGSRPGRSGPRRARRNSSARYSLHVPGVVRLLGARAAPASAGSGSRRRRRRPAPSIDLKCSRIAPGSCDVLDRLQEDDGVAGLGEASRPGRARSAGWGARSAAARARGPRGWRRRRPRSARRAGQHVGAVALAAGHVDHAQAADPRRDPLVDDEVAPVPVVLLGNVGQRPLAGQRQRRHPLAAGLPAGISSVTGPHRIAADPIKCPPRMPASPTATPEHIKDVNTRYHDAAADEYDAKWGIDFGDIGQEQVRLKLVKALGGAAGRDLRRRARDRLRDRLLLAQPGAARA